MQKYILFICSIVLCASSLSAQLTEMASFTKSLNDLKEKIKPSTRPLSPPPGGKIPPPPPPRKPSGPPPPPPPGGKAPLKIITDQEAVTLINEAPNLDEIKQEGSEGVRKYLATKGHTITPKRAGEILKLVEGGGKKPSEGGPQAPKGNPLVTEAAAIEFVKKALQEGKVNSDIKGIYTYLYKEKMFPGSVQDVPQQSAFEKKIKNLEEFKGGTTKRTELKSRFELAVDEMNKAVATGKKFRNMFEIGSFLSTKNIYPDTNELNALEKRFAPK